MTLLAACAIALLIQDPGEVLARYRLGDKPASVTRTDVAVEMAFHLQRDPLGKDACQVLVDSALTRRAAERENLMPSEADVRRYWQKLQQQLRDAGHDPADFPAVRNSTESEWLRDLAVQIAQERLVRNALALGADEPVSGDMLRLWLSEQRKKCTAVTDPDALPMGVAARVDGRDIPLVELGLLLYRTSEDRERERFVRQVVYLQSVEHRAAELGIEVDRAALEAAIEARRAASAKNPRYQGLTFEQLLETRGLTVESLLRSRVFRGKILQERLTDAEYPPDRLRAELQSDRAAIAERHGARRRIGVIFRRALDEPNALVKHDFDSATRSLEQVRERLAIERFDLVARIETDDPRGKQTGGDTGWHHRRSERLPEPVLAAAFAAAKGDVLGPLRAEAGCYLVKLLDVEGPVEDALLLERLRSERIDEHARRIMDEAGLELPAASSGGERKN